MGRNKPEVPDSARELLRAKQEFARLQIAEQHAIDDAESKVIEDFTRQKFMVIAAMPEAARDQQFKDFYAEWSFKWQEDGSPAPTIMVPSQAELARLEKSDILNQSAAAADRRSPGGRIRP